MTVIHITFMIMLMLKILSSLFIPHKNNRYHPYLLRLPSLFLIAALLVGLILLPYFPQFKAKNILGVGTNITISDIIKFTNQQRTQNGLPPLIENQILDRGAEAKAADMFAKNYWAHFAPDGTSPWYFFNKAGYGYLYAGENLAKNFDSSNQVVTAWMNSPSHRENLLNPKYRDIGIGIMNGTLQGEQTTLVVQFFGAPTSQAATTTFVAAASAAPTPKPSLQPLPTLKATAGPAVAGFTPSSPPTSLTPLTSPTKESPPQTLVGSFRFDPLSSLKLAASAPYYQKFVLITLVLLLNMFILDRVVLLSYGVRRLHTGHSSYHIIVISVLIAALLFISKGAIL